MMMMRAWTLLLLPVIALAQDNLVSRGGEIFANTCATGYCHGVKGAAGGAPRLVARGFTAQYIRQVVTNGEKEMPAFGGKLEARDLNAVIAYVASLNGLAAEAVAGRGGGRAMTGPPARVLSPEAAKGRALFFDATRGFGRCSTCHQLDGNGIAIADPMNHVPENSAALRDLPTPHVRTFTSGAETFPAEVVKNSGGEAIVYDLTSAPPVRRTFSNAKIQLDDHSNWRHSAAMQSYTDADLESILAFLRVVVKQ
jgi:mono/diheme cytochrome c family protein